LRALCIIGITSIFLLAGGENSTIGHATTIGNRKYYVVKKGDTLFSIARRFGVEVHELRNWNALGKTGRLIQGTRLVITERGKKEERSGNKNKDLLALTFGAHPPKMIKKFQIGKREYQPMVTFQCERRRMVAGYSKGITERVGRLPGFGEYVVIRYRPDLQIMYSGFAERNVKRGDPIVRGYPLGSCSRREQSNHGSTFSIMVLDRGKAKNPMLY